MLGLFYWFQPHCSACFIGLSHIAQPVLLVSATLLSLFYWLEPHCSACFTGFSHIAQPVLLVSATLLSLFYWFQPHCSACVIGLSHITQSLFIPHVIITVVVADPASHDLIFVHNWVHQAQGRFTCAALLCPVYRPRHHHCCSPGLHRGSPWWPASAQHLDPCLGAHTAVHSKSLQISSPLGTQPGTGQDTLTVMKGCSLDLFVKVKATCFLPT